MSVETVSRSSRRFRPACFGALLLGLAAALCLAGAAPAAEAGTIDPRVDDAVREAGPEGTVSVLIHLTEQAPVAALRAELKARKASRAARHETIVRALRETAARSQAPLLEALDAGRRQGQVIGYTPYWITNLVVAQVRTSFLERLAARADVAVIAPNPTVELVEPVARERWCREARSSGALRGAESGA
ncbi:MAG: hypothetical protein GF330_13375, partial [Candidatus Eisenbacteria bacterium]|nr:hypothetical protein [Candidatus Eisenbacteria bacterium]